jgi:hypothetical protein
LVFSKEGFFFQAGAATAAVEKKKENLLLCHKFFKELKQRNAAVVSKTVFSQFVFDPLPTKVDLGQEEHISISRAKPMTLAWCFICIPLPLPPSIHF